MSHEPVVIGLPKLASKRFTYHRRPTMGIKHRHTVRQKVAADDNRGYLCRPTKHLEPNQCKPYSRNGIRLIYLG
ncbi:hypothetical protein Bca52824_041498 [Brassica carinata]|uniref:Uncharacterized protein n=1 Tax=Brassica carinata TaxID=52824 RepID=A0A8X7RTC2_BRACI|nr:hypothetical protein Bca52824_041498 [Brassica carinata]